MVGKKWVCAAGFRGAGAVWPWLVAGSMPGAGPVGCILWVVFPDLRGAGVGGNGWWLVAGVMPGAGAMGDGWWLG